MGQCLIYTCCMAKADKIYSKNICKYFLKLFVSVTYCLGWFSHTICKTLLFLESMGGLIIFFLSPLSSWVYRVGHNEVIGVCRVGNDADSLGRDHWSEMLTYPRKPVAHWHPLVEVRWHVLTHTHTHTY